jgi:hypothetical protein
MYHLVLSESIVYYEHDNNINQITFPNTEVLFFYDIETELIYTLGYSGSSSIPINGKDGDIFVDNENWAVYVCYKDRWKLTSSSMTPGRSCNLSAFYSSGNISVYDDSDFIFTGCDISSGDFKLADGNQSVLFTKNGFYVATAYVGKSSGKGVNQNDLRLNGCTLCGSHVGHDVTTGGHTNAFFHANSGDTLTLHNVSPLLNFADCEDNAIDYVLTIIMLSSG